MYSEVCIQVQCCCKVQLNESSFVEMFNLIVFGLYSAEIPKCLSFSQWPNSHVSKFQSKFEAILYIIEQRLILEKMKL